mmetsp:Transcript_17137/g.52988  ORF Transcript_17137/g.52988 Transcript_17137/m.52988 type:complete len:544 (+) Transcript_17137:92-1723(+)
MLDALHLHSLWPGGNASPPRVRLRPPSISQPTHVVGEEAAAAVRALLALSRQAGTAYRLAVSVPAIAVGVTVSTISLVVFILYIFALESMPRLPLGAPSDLFLAPLLAGIPLVLLALLPTDQAILNVITPAMALVCTACLVLAVVRTTSLLIGDCDPDLEYAAVPPSTPVGCSCWERVARVDSLVCAWALKYSLQQAAAVVGFACGTWRFVYAALRLRRRPRAALAECWALLAVLYWTLALYYLVDGVWVAAVYSETWTTESAWLTGGRLGVSSESLLLALITTPPSFRARAQSALARLSGKDTISTAAGIASLMGERAGDVSGLVTLAQQRFRCVRFADLRNRTPFAGPVGGIVGKNYDVSQPARLGDVDAFLSHSWHDPPGPKHAALDTTRDRLAKEAGLRAPEVEGLRLSLWFDMFCIDQTDVDQDLALLPIYMASCRRLVIYCGPTYLSRLWCIVELFVFLSMGGKPSQVSIHLLDGTPSLTTIAATFDARHAECFKEEDKDRMLSFIERSSGSVEVFNDKVRAMFAQVEAEHALGDGG